MRIVLQRVKQAAVSVQAEIVGTIDTGLLLFVGFGSEDHPALPETAPWKKMIAKISELRIFPDAEGRSNRSLREVQGELLVVSQFTLYANCRKGRRPSFIEAADPKVAEALYSRFLRDMAEQAPARVQSGIFGADMDISSINWGPVTMILDSETI